MATEDLISATSHSNTDNNTGEESPGRKSPSISAAIAIFGGGNIKNKPSNNNINQHTQKQQQQPIISKPLKPWQRPSQVANNDDNDIISDSSILDANHQSPLGKNKLPIINVLEVEKDEEVVLDKVCEEEEQDTKEIMVDDKDEEEMIVDDNRQQQGEDGDSTIMDMSDSEAGASQFEPEEDVEEEPEWEDFMENYWKLSSATTDTNLSTTIKEEDTDLKPCLIDPELDVDEPLASNNNTGFSIDIDMDCDDAKILSNVGLDCSIIMSRLAQDNKDGNSIESLRIDISRVKRKKKKTNSVGKEKDPVKEEARQVPQSRIGLEPPDELHSPPSAFFNPHTHHYQTKNKTATVSSPSQPVQQEMMNIPTPTKSFDNDTAAGASTVGSDVASSAAGSQSWKHNIDKSSPLPIAELIHGTGSISTRTSLRALVMKKWHPSYWMHYGPHTLLIFRSKEHMDDWATNPYHSSKQREFLVKLEINFMVDMESNHDGKDTGILGHRLLPMKQKSYGKKDEDEMFQFKLERWTNLGCSVLAAFASHEEAEVQVLYNTICDILKTCPNNGLKDISHMLK